MGVEEQSVFDLVEQQGRREVHTWLHFIFDWFRSLARSRGFNDQVFSTSDPVPTLLRLWWLCAGMAVLCGGFALEWLYTGVAVCWRRVETRLGSVETGTGPTGQKHLGNLLPAGNMVACLHLLSTITCIYLAAGGGKACENPPWLC